MNYKKPALTQREAEDEVILKWMYGEPMTCEEAALALWMHEGRRTHKPMSKMYINNIERNALAKLKRKLISSGIKNLDDIFDRKYQKNGKGSISDSVDENA